jgi:alpha-amylase/alpha-mannosidase (GH57 family)
MDRYICIHGHFYQPPRENPWLEAVEVQSSAYPYHDWNARISAECYAANAASRILDGDGKIAQITNNYANISYNFGPTLMLWLAPTDTETYENVLAADRLSQERFGGHGSAIAQVYNHMIMPLANERDKYTQIRWGIRDFTFRFGRTPEGMWLAETAVDLPTLEALAECGITFTILAPHQAGQIRPLGADDDAWENVSGARIDPTRAYRQFLPSGKHIDLFFYDGPISRAVGFEHLLDSGEGFANRLAGAFNDERDQPQLVHIATDGETYGHHFRHADMALAYALQYIEDHGIATITNYGQFLELHPPTHEVQISEDTSWSCAHGIERWRSDCGCNSGGYPQWNQEWRLPLRAALDWLRDALAPVYEDHARALFADPWAARDQYIDIILDRGNDNVTANLNEWARRELNDEETVTALRLLEMQRHALLMYTSCGWFFDELSGIETVQVIEYAARAVQLAKTWCGEQIETGFLEQLAHAKSNLPEHGDGRAIYEKWVKPTSISLSKVTAHYAMSDLFEQYPDTTDIYCYNVARHEQRMISAGNTRLVVGQARVTSHITHDADEFSFTALHFENHNLTGGVRITRSDEEYAHMVQELTDAFDHADLATTIRLLDDNFDRRLYSLSQLFRDEQLKILDIIMEGERQSAEGQNQSIYDRNVALLRFLADQHIPPPDVLKFAAETALHARLRAAIEADPLNPDLVRQLLHEAALSGVTLHSEELNYRLRGRLNTIIDAFRDDPADTDRLAGAVAAAALARDMPGEVDLWHAQNVYYDLLQRHGADWRDQMAQAADGAHEWWEQITRLGDLLHVQV